jgi:hypothetical protein
VAHEQTFGELIDTEHLFVLQWDGSEQVFEGGEAMSVALELEYEAFYSVPRAVAPLRPVSSPSRFTWRRVILATVVVVLLVLLMLPIRALGGKTVGAATPVAGQVYVVRSGDSLASIAARVGGGNVAGLERQMAAATGSTVLVPGEHLLIP